MPLAILLVAAKALNGIPSLVQMPVNIYSAHISYTFSLPRNAVHSLALGHF